MQTVKNKLTTKSLSVMYTLDNCSSENGECSSAFAALLASKLLPPATPTWSTPAGMAVCDPELEDSEKILAKNKDIKFKELNLRAKKSHPPIYSAQGGLSYKGLQVRPHKAGSFLGNGAEGETGFEPQTTSKDFEYAEIERS